MGSKSVDQIEAEKLKAFYEHEMRYGGGRLGNGLQGIGAAQNQAASIDRESQQRAIARGEFLRRLIYDVPKIQQLDYFDVQMNSTNDNVTVFLIVRGEAMHLTEEPRGFPTKDFISKMALLIP